VRSGRRRDLATDGTGRFFKLGAATLDSNAPDAGAGHLLVSIFEFRSVISLMRTVISLMQTVISLM